MSTVEDNRRIFGCYIVRNGNILGIREAERNRWEIITLLKFPVHFSNH